MTELKSFDELEIGDVFLTEWIDGSPIKLTVEIKTDDGLVIPKELGGLDFFLEEFYVVGHVDLNMEPQKSYNTSTYWVIETLINNQIHYWTGNIPHLSISESEEGLPMWTPDIHEAKKMPTELDARTANDDFGSFGVVAEHMDV